jgi:hypothetical protein
MNCIIFSNESESYPFENSAFDEDEDGPEEDEIDCEKQEVDVDAANGVPSVKRFDGKTRNLNKQV